MSDPVKRVLQKMSDHIAQFVSLNPSILMLIGAKHVCIPSAHRDRRENLALKVGPEFNHINLGDPTCLMFLDEVNNFFSDDLRDCFKLALEKSCRELFARRVVILVEGIH